MGTGPAAARSALRPTISAPAPARSALRPTISASIPAMRPRRAGQGTLATLIATFVFSTSCSRCLMQWAMIRASSGFESWEAWM